MTLTTETTTPEPDVPCGDCGWVPVLDVYRSEAGFYIGTHCACGPNSRDSEDYVTREEARSALQTGAFAGP